MPQAPKEYHLVKLKSLSSVQQDSHEGRRLLLPEIITRQS
jgi:hypothetical protein